MKHYKIKVTGRVQGVFYRASAKNKAEELNIMGYVKNLADGSVFIEAQGLENDLKKFVDWCAKGPVNAIVKNIEIDETELLPFKRFEIRYD